MKKIKVAICFLVSLLAVVSTQEVFAKGDMQEKDIGNRKVVYSGDKFEGTFSNKYTFTDDGKGSYVWDKGSLSGKNLAVLEDNKTIVSNGSNELDVSYKTVEPLEVSVDSNAKIVLGKDNLETLFVKDSDNDKINLAVNSNGNIEVTKTGNEKATFGILMKNSDKLAIETQGNVAISVIGLNAFEGVANEGNVDVPNNKEVQSDVNTFLGNNDMGKMSRLVINNPTYHKSQPDIPADWSYTTETKANSLREQPMYELHDSNGQKHIVFCFDPFVSVNRPQGAEYPRVSIDSLKALNGGSTLRKVEYIVYYGWTNAEKSIYNWYTTQVLIWEVLINEGWAKTAPANDGGPLTYGRGEDFVIKSVNIKDGNKNYNDRKKDLLRNAEALVKGVDLEGGTRIKVKQGQSVTVKDKNGAIGLMNIVSQKPDGIDVKFGSDSITITASKRAVSGKMWLQAIADKEKGDTTMYGIQDHRSDTQWLAYPAVGDINKFPIDIEVEEVIEANVKLVKKDSMDNLPIPGVKFDLQYSAQGGDSDYNSVGEYVTDENGEINVANLKEGHYKFVEMEPLTGYKKLEQTVDFEVNKDNRDQTIELEVENEREPIDITTEFASKEDGSKLVVLYEDNLLVDKLTMHNTKEGHTYYVDTEYINKETGEVVSSDSSTFVGNGEEVQNEEVELLVPKDTLKDGDKLVATHKIYSDEDKTNLVGEEYDLENEDQTVIFVNHKLEIKTLFAVKKDGSKTADPTKDNELEDKIKIGNTIKDHKYYVDTEYVNKETKEVVAKDSSTFVGNGEKEQNESVSVTIPKNAMKDADKLVATHKIYSDETKKNLVGEEYNLDNEDQTVTFTGLPKTGNKVNTVAIVGTLAVVAILGGYIVSRKKYNL